MRATLATVVLATTSLIVGTQACDTAGGNVTVPGGPGGTLADTASGNGAAPRGSDGTLAGTWDITGTTGGYGMPTSVVVTMDDSTLSILTDGGFVEAKRQGDAFAIQYQLGGSAAVEHVATRTGSGLSLGVIPVPLGGDWTIASDWSYGTCSWSLSESAFSASCKGANGLPTWMPSIQSGLAVGQKKKSLESVFGTVGGEWQVDFSEGGTCLFTLEGSRIRAQCFGVSGLSGTTDITFDGDTITGLSTEGFEFTARRR